MKSILNAVPKTTPAATLSLQELHQHCHVRPISFWLIHCGQSPDINLAKNQSSNRHRALSNPPHTPHIWDDSEFQKREPFDSVCAWPINKKGLADELVPRDGP